MDYEIGKYKSTTTASQPRPVSTFIWGPSGAGKTVLSSTARGKKLWLQFDPGGSNSLPELPDITLFDLSSEGYSVLNSFRQTDPFNLRAFLAKNPFDTLVVDSLTMINDMALHLAVSESKQSTISLPGQHGYALRNNIVHDIAKGLLTLTNSLQMDFVLVGHEGQPDKDEMTGRIYQSPMLGGNLANLLSLRFSELWYLEDTGKERRISVRSNPNRKPMKSRMFDTSKADSFVWKFDNVKREGEGMSSWIDKWKANGGKPIAIPG